jgi:alkylhydroperoxidase family enzyme
MTRIPPHTLNDAPPASQPLLAAILPASPTGRPLNFQAQMAHSPEVLTAYLGLRRAAQTQGLLDQDTRIAIMVASASVLGNDYALAVTSMLARRGGIDEEHLTKLVTGSDTGDERTDTLLAVTREAARHAGSVPDEIWQRARDRGWSSEQLAEAFAPMGLIAYTTWFMNYAQAKTDLPTPLGSVR